jgi:hypothetical protein
VHHRAAHVSSFSRLPPTHKVYTIVATDGAARGPDRRQSHRSGQGRSKLDLAGERGGLPLALIVSAANANDSTMLEAVLEDIPAIRMPTGRRRRPGKVHADKAYDHRRCPR